MKIFWIPVVLLGALGAAFLYLEKLSLDQEQEKSRRMHTLQVLEKQREILAALEKQYGPTPEVLQAHMETLKAWKQDPQNFLKTGAKRFSIDVKNVQGVNSQWECAFIAPLDTDVYEWLKEMESQHFQVISLGLYRDKIANHVQGRLVCGGP